LSGSFRGKTRLPAVIPAAGRNIESFRGLLQRTVIKKDIITFQEITTTEPSDLVSAYSAKRAAFEDAFLQYPARRIDARTATNSRAVHDFAMNAQICRNKVHAAEAQSCK
jgi:hypothetical protein